MLTRATFLVLLLLLPPVGFYVAGWHESARVFLVGAVLALYLSSVARPIAPFGVLVPFVYAGAAMTANLTDGVAALIVAVAAATGAASSVGYHRGLLAVLAAALIGSLEPAAAGVVGHRMLLMLAGATYGVALGQTVGRTFTMRTLAVGSRTALGYAVLLALLVVVAWFVARSAGLEQAWWVPLAVAALGEPWLDGTPGRAVARLAVALAGTVALLALLDRLVLDPWSRAACAAVLLITSLAVDRRHATLQAFLLTPVLMLLVEPNERVDTTVFLQPALIAFAAVAAFAVLGKWMLWTLRPDAGHAAV